MASPPARATLSRRSILRSGLWGSAFVALSGLGLGLQDTLLPPGIPSDLKVLSGQEYAVLTALADRVCPKLEGRLPAASELGIPAKVDAMFEHADSDEREGLKLGLRLFEHPLSGALFGERLRPFTRLDAREQEQVLRAWRDSTVAFRRTVFAGLSGLVASLYWTDPSTWRFAGYPGVPETAKLRQAYAENLVDLEALRAGSAAKPSQGT